ADNAAAAVQSIDKRGADTLNRVSVRRGEKDVPAVVTAELEVHAAAPGVKAAVSERLDCQNFTEIFALCTVCDYVDAYRRAVALRIVRGQGCRRRQQYGHKYSLSRPR